METIELIELGVTIAGGYLALGVLIAIPFVLRGVDRVDPAAAEGTRGFRALIFPGAVLLWPLMLPRWLAPSTTPPEERSAHRRAAVARDGGES